MFLLIIISALALWAIIATFIELRRDGYRAVATDWSRVGARDTSPLQQAESMTSYR